MDLQWHRYETDKSPKGHGMRTKFRNRTWVAWQDAGGVWKVRATDRPQDRREFKTWAEARDYVKKSAASNPGPQRVHSGKSAAPSATLAVGNPKRGAMKTNANPQSLTKAEVRDFKIRLDRVGRKLPKIHHCIRLNRQVTGDPDEERDLCRDDRGYYLTEVGEPLYRNPSTAMKTKNAKGRTKKKSFDVPEGISVVWSPVNQAYFVLFGRGPVETRSVLAVVPKDQIDDYVRDLRRVNPKRTVKRVSCGTLSAKKCRQLQHVYESARDRGFSKERSAKQAWGAVERTNPAKGITARQVRILESIRDATPSGRHRLGAAGIRWARERGFAYAPAGHPGEVRLTKEGHEALRNRNPAKGSKGEPDTIAGDEETRYAPPGALQNPTPRGRQKNGAGTGAFVGSMVGSLAGMGVGSVPLAAIGSIAGGALGGHYGAPKDRQTRGAVGGAIGGGVLGPIGAGVGGWIGGKKADKHRNPRGHAGRVYTVWKHSTNKRWFVSDGASVAATSPNGYATKAEAVKSAEKLIGQRGVPARIEFEVDANPKLEAQQWLRVDQQWLRKGMIVKAPEWILMDGKKVPFGKYWSWRRAAPKQLEVEYWNNDEGESKLVALAPGGWPVLREYVDANTADYPREWLVDADSLDDDAPTVAQARDQGVYPPEWQGETRNPADHGCGVPCHCGPNARTASLARRIQI